MRFLCENCKAKYQIADEKLSGRSVRMKCRKCGHMIDVPSIEASSPGASPVAPAPKVAPASPAPIAPKPAPLGPSPRPAAPSATAARPARPAPVRPASPVARPAPQPEPLAPAAPAAGGLAQAFNRTVRSPADSDVSAAIEVLSAGAGEEWYVGINGVPLGPVRLSAIRQKASQGVINEESLVWREGFEEWLPLRSFPELLTLLNEARDQAGRASLSPAAPQTTRRTPSQPPPAARVAPPVSAKPAVIETSPTVPLAVDDDDEMATVMAPAPSAALYGEVTADPFANPPMAAPLPAAGVPSQALPPPSARVEVPLRASVPPDDMAARRSLVEDLAVGVRRQVRMHPAAYVLIALAAGFGVTGAVVVFTGDKVVAPPPTIQVVTVTAPAATAPVAAASGASETRDLTEVAVAGGTRAGGTVPATTTEAAGHDTSDPSKGTGAAPRVGLGDGPNVGGPTVGGPTAGGGAVAQLEQADIERVVASQRSGVKRRCWEPALAAKEPNAPPSAKVNVSITIGADGHVQSARASGGDGYPGLASCVQQRVSGWTFPPSSGESRANIPFAFFSQ